MDSASILRDLDKHASEFNFPVLDNAYVQFASAQLSAFRSERDWLIVFEVLGYSIKEAAFVDDIYAYGSCALKEGFIGEVMVAEPMTDRPLFDPSTGESIADWNDWSIKVGSHDLHFAPSAREYEEAGIVVAPKPGRGSIQPIQLLRFLFSKLGIQLFSDDKTLLQQFPNCRCMERFLRTTEWQHPDIAGGETPSMNPSLRSLLHALERADASFFDPGRPNTRWQEWDERV